MTKEKIFGKKKPTYLYVTPVNSVYMLHVAANVKSMIFKLQNQRKR
jgi:hypothetical protein